MPAIRDIVLGGAVIAVRVKPKRVGAGSVQDASAKEVGLTETTSDGFRSGPEAPGGLGRSSRMLARRGVSGCRRFHGQAQEAPCLFERLATAGMKQDERSVGKASVST